MLHFRAKALNIDLKKSSRDVQLGGKSINSSLSPPFFFFCCCYYYRETNFNVSFCCCCCCCCCTAFADVTSPSYRVAIYFEPVQYGLVCAHQHTQQCPRSSIRSYFGFPTPPKQFLRTAGFLNLLLRRAGHISPIG